MMGINDKYVKYYQGCGGSDSMLFNFSRTTGHQALLKSFLEKIRRHFLAGFGYTGADKKFSVKKKEKKPSR
jgi:hypothetical protein